MRFLRRTAAALAATVGLVALPAAAHAGTIVEFSADGGATWSTICSSSTNSCSGSASAFGGNLTITIAGVNSDSPGSAGSSDIFTSATTIANTGSAAEIVLRYASDGFTAPTSGTFESNLGGTGVNNSSSVNVATLTSCIVAGSIGTNPAPASNVPCPGGTTLTNAGIAVNSPSFNNSMSQAGVTTTAPYLLGEQLDVHIASGAVGSATTLNFANSTDLIATPEPASIVLMGTGLFGLVGFVRRRKGQI